LLKSSRYMRVAYKPLIRSTRSTVITQVARNSTI
jgi:hypothetical protein